MTDSVTSAQREEYDRNGALVLRGAVGKSWRARLEQAIDADLQEPGPYFHGYDTAGQGRFHGNLRLFEQDPVLRAFCLSSSLPLLARSLFQAHRINLLYDQLFVKDPHTHERTRWHNDQPYWPIRGWQVLSIWVALDDTTADSGALEFIRGSHRWGRWFQPEVFGKTAAVEAYEVNADYEPIPDIEAARDDYDIVSWDLEPGDVYVFHGLTVHGSSGNRRGDRRRRGYAVRYTGDDVVYDGRAGTNKSLQNPSLQDGDILDSEQYPVIS